MINKLYEAIKAAERIALISHVNPDGDTIGSALGFRLALKKIGKTVGVFCENPLPQAFSFLPGSSEFKLEFDGDYDLYIAVDCGDSFRMGSSNLSIYQKKAVTANIDHHFTNPRFAHINHIVNASSTAEIIYGIIVKTLGIELDADIATCLYTGIITDTANFQHNNTTPSTHIVAAELMKCGAPFDTLAYKFLKERTYNKTRLIARALNSIRMLCDNQIAVIVLRTEDFTATGCNNSDTEGIVEYAVNISGVKAGITASQQINPNQYKVSFRSNGDVDVALAASSFGGGGHKRAAGCILHGDIEDIVVKLVKSCSDQFPF